MINIIKDVDIIDHVSEYDVTLIGANINSTMGEGLAFDVKTLYPYVRKTNISTKYGDESKLGTIIESSCDGEPTFCLCFILKNMNTRKDIKKDNLNYESLEKCLQLVNVLYKGKKIASPLLGTSRFDGNGDKDKVIEIFNNTLKDVNVDIYDYYQETIKEKWFKAFYKGKELKEQDKDKWQKFVEESKKRFTVKKN